MSLDELLRAVQGGESRAELRLFQRLRIELLPFFRRRVDTPDAEDLTQETLAFIVRTLQSKTFEPQGPTSFRSFAFVAAHFRLRTHRKTRQRRRRIVDSWWVALESGADPRPDEMTLSQQQAELFQVAMAVLQTRYRRALESRLRDEDPQEFADAEGIKLGTVRSWIYRALVLLSAEIEARRQTVLT